MGCSTNEEEEVLYSSPGHAEVKGLHVTSYTSINNKIKSGGRVSNTLLIYASARCTNNSPGHAEVKGLLVTSYTSIKNKIKSGGIVSNTLLIYASARRTNNSLKF